LLATTAVHSRCAAAPVTAVSTAATAWDARNSEPRDRRPAFGRPHPVGAREPWMNRLGLPPHTGARALTRRPHPDAGQASEDEAPRPRQTPAQRQPPVPLRPGLG